MKDNYQFKTDREQQWALIEQRDREEGRPRKNINEEKRLFFGDIDPVLKSTGRLLLIYSNC